MDQSELQKKHFAALKEKYQVSALKTAASSNFLYFVLRKAELGIKITGLEKQWMLKNGLFETTEMIAVQEYQALDQDRLEDDLSNLKSRYKVPENVKIPIVSPIYSILWRVDSGEIPGDSEVNFLPG